MSSTPVRREQLPDGRLRLSAQRCTFVHERLWPGALLVTISGSDMGQFGTVAVPVSKERTQFSRSTASTSRA